MSKTNKFLALALGLVTMLFVNSCVEDDDFKVPEVLVPTVNPAEFGTRITFQQVINRYNQAIADGDNVGTFEFDDNIYIEGYVISSDASGNYFEEIIIQNSIDENDLSPEDPRKGLKIEINQRDLANFYNVGRKVYVRLNIPNPLDEDRRYMAVSLENGVYSLGKGNGQNFGQLEPFEYEDFVIRDPEVVTVMPKILNSFDDLVDEDKNTLVQFSNSQFSRNAILDTNSYAGEDEDQFDGFRLIENCDDNSTIILQTSTFADFKSFPLASGQGSITGVYSRDFGDDFDVLIVNDTDAISFTSPDRCDPIELICGIASTTGTVNLFNDDFESQSNNTLITGNGWTNFIQEGSEGWEAYTQGGTNSSLGRSARVGSFNSGDASSIAWLITPAVDLDANSGVTINFKTSNSFSDGSEMELLFSNDWDGTEANITSATWGIIPEAYIVQDSDFFGAWFDSENVDLSCGTGTIHIAFKYTGSGDSSSDGTYELDEITIDAL